MQFLNCNVYSISLSLSMHALCKSSWIEVLLLLLEVIQIKFPKPIQCVQQSPRRNHAPVLVRLRNALNKQKNRTTNLFLDVTMTFKIVKWRKLKRKIITGEHTNGRKFKRKIITREYTYTCGSPFTLFDYVLVRRRPNAN